MMEQTFWHGKWQREEISFHLSEVNPLLARHFPRLNLRQGARVFMPLCGKSVDMLWLRAQGHTVIGAELSPLAVEQFFAEAGLTPTIEPRGAVTLYGTPEIEIFCGDIFALSGADLGHIDAIYDRAALVALPHPLRQRYAEHLVRLTHAADQLLITYTYDQTVQPGPPFSVEEAELKTLYAGVYAAEPCEIYEIPGGLRGLCAAQETVWHLRAHHGAA